MAIWIRTVVVVLGSLFFLRVSWRSLQNPDTHGFYRFFIFEGILLLVVLNQPRWFVDPFSLLQLLSWSFLAISICFLMQSLWMLKKWGGHAKRQDMPANFGFENTVHVVDEGLYRFIRHPMYSSLLFLAWGAYLKGISLVSSVLILGVTFFLFIAAKVEEGENLRFFGESYRRYMGRSKMFIPWIF